jgi:hypothetical protein
MADIKEGDHVRVKGRQEWPSPPGYVLAGAEGTVVKWIEDDEVMAEFQDFICIELDKADGEAQMYLGNEFFFLAENLEKI